MSRRYAFLVGASLVAVGCASTDFQQADPGSDDSSIDDSSGDSSRDDSSVLLDTFSPDALGTDGGGIDTALPTDAPASCIGRPDGSPCDSSDGKRRICAAGGCTLSKCGDDIVDPSAGEECDDGNDVSNDGCEPVTCKFSCHSATECPSTACITGRTCDGTHKCTDGSFAPKSTTCTTGSGVAGYCNAGACASASCGNHTVEPGEECDDGDTDNTNGCKNDCTFTCKIAADCDDHNACNGVESCNTVPHTCTPGSALTCDDSNACTSNKCVTATGCTNPFIDADGDGFAPAPAGTCGGAFAGKDGDCNDGNSAVHPGATETCNGIDDNCNGGVDEGLAASTCGVGECQNTGSTCLPTSCTPKPSKPEICNDLDDNCNGVVDDGVAVASCGIGACARTGTTCHASSCLPGAPTPEVCNGVDDNCDGTPDDVGGSCFTGPGNVSKGTCHAGTNACGASAPFAPLCSGQVTADTTFHGTPGTPGGSGQSAWDYNCDGTDERFNTSIGSCSFFSSICTLNAAGWIGTIPTCGESGNYVGSCDSSSGCKANVSFGYVQKCR